MSRTSMEKTSYGRLTDKEVGKHRGEWVAVSDSNPKQVAFHGADLYEVWDKIRDDGKLISDFDIFPIYPIQAPDDSFTAGE